MPWTEVRPRSYCTGNRPPRIAASSVPAASGDRRFFTVSARSTGFSLGNLVAFPSHQARACTTTRACSFVSPRSSATRPARRCGRSPPNCASIPTPSLSSCGAGQGSPIRPGARPVSSRSPRDCWRPALTCQSRRSQRQPASARRACSIDSSAAAADNRRPNGVCSRPASTALARTSTFWTIHQHSRGLTTPTPMSHSSHPPRRLCSSSNETSWLPGVASTRCSGRSSGDDVVAAPGRERCRIRRGSR